MRIVELRIARTVLEKVIAHAHSATPAECCGLLLGTSDHVVDATPTHNVAASPTRYLIDSADHIAGRREARQRGLDVVGFYHSHPHSAAAPSERDRAEAGYPDHLYLIVGLHVDPPDIQLFALRDGNFRSVPFVTVG